MKPVLSPSYPWPPNCDCRFSPRDLHCGVDAQTGGYGGEGNEVVSYRSCSGEASSPLAPGDFPEVDFCKGVPASGKTPQAGCAQNPLSTRGPAPGVTLSLVLSQSSPAWPTGDAQPSSSSEKVNGQRPPVFFSCGTGHRPCSLCSSLQWLPTVPQRKFQLHFSTWQCQRIPSSTSRAPPQVFPDCSSSLRG